MKTYNERTVSILEKAKTKRRNRNLTIAAICGVLVLCITAVPLLMPYRTTPPSVEQYASSDYYPVIEKLNTLKYEPPRYKNAFEEYILAPMRNFATSIGQGKWESIGGIMDNGDGFLGGSNYPTADMNTGVLGSSPGAEKYEETTDNQVTGIIEGDRIKRSSNYIYYLSGSTLRIYSIEGSASKEIGRHEVASTDNYRLESYKHEWEMFLSKDCKTITLITSAIDNATNHRHVVLINLDVSDPANIKEGTRTYLTGKYLTARLVEDELLLVANFHPSTGNMDFSNPTSFVPQYGSEGKMECIDAGNIVAPDTLTTSQYSVICKLNQSTLEAISTAAFLSYSEEVYVSENSIYTTRQYTEETVKDNATLSEIMTEITAISYNGAKLEPAGSVIVTGYLENQYSMDEYEGILRVVTTTDTDFTYRDYNGFLADGIEPFTRGTNANLYCIDLSTWKIAASVEQFAPQNEVVKSVRFDKTAAYVCTAVELTFTDPVFYFDLSDLNNITYKDTGTISGYSLSLVNFGEYLLGIGYGDNESILKIELYQETPKGVASVTSYEVPDCNFSTDYKAYYIDRENMRIGLGLHRYGFDNSKDCYVLLQFDGYDLVELFTSDITGNDDYKRAVYIDGYFYMFGDNFIVKEI